MDARAAHLVPPASLGKAGRGVIGGRDIPRPEPFPAPLDEEISWPMTMTTLLAAAAPSAGAGFFIQSIPLVLVFIIFYLLLIRPQQRKMKEHQAQIAAVKKGDRVVTGGGLIGRVTKVGDSEVEVELAQGIRVQAVKSTLTQVVDPTAKPAND
jgi:preprotein translocase subunit YajC